MSDQPLPYRGERLGERPHVAVFFRDQIGDFLVSTPLMRGLRERFPRLVLDYFGGERTRELEEASRLVDARWSVYGRVSDHPAVAAPGQSERPNGSEADRVLLERFLDERRRVAGPYDLVINLESDRQAAEAATLAAPRFAVGKIIGPDGEPRLVHGDEPIDRLWSDMGWNRPTLLADYPGLESQFIGEIFCRLARVETEYTRTEAPISDPPIPTPPVLLSTGANRSARLWPTQSWLAVVGWAGRHGLTVGLLGAAPTTSGGYNAIEVDRALLGAGVADLRGRLTLPQVAGALSRALAVVSIDNGLMHLAAAVGAPTVALFGASPQRLWAPRSPCVRIVEPSNPCSICEDNRFQNPDCLLPVHQCMVSVEPERVIVEVEAILSGRCAS